MIIYILFVWIANIIIFLSLPRNPFLTYVLSPIPSRSVLYRKYFLWTELTISYSQRGAIEVAPLVFQPQV